MALKAILFIGSDTTASERPHAFERVPLGDDLQRVTNVDEALTYLDGLQNGRKNELVPAIVLVSSTVESNGVSKLASFMRSGQALKDIPIVALTPAAHVNSSKNPPETAADAHFVRVNDTDTLLDIVSKHLPGSSGGRSLHHAFLA